jgi:hypothetical protein
VEKDCQARRPDPVVTDSQVFSRLSLGFPGACSPVSAPCCRSSGVSCPARHGAHAAPAAAWRACAASGGAYRPLTYRRRTRRVLRVCAAPSTARTASIAGSPRATCSARIWRATIRGSVCRWAAAGHLQLLQQLPQGEGQGNHLGGGVGGQQAPARAAFGSGVGPAWVLWVGGATLQEVRSFMKHLQAPRSLWG